MLATAPFVHGQVLVEWQRLAPRAPVKMATPSVLVGVLHWGFAPAHWLAFWHSLPALETGTTAEASQRYKPVVLLTVMLLVSFKLKPTPFGVTHAKPAGAQALSVPRVRPQLSDAHMLPVEQNVPFAFAGTNPVRLLSQ
ncbi:MAG: hypothetical protein KF837_39285 [Labilithrix sp.]|nr:hypothetical protein [Labilithrix sp.]